MRYAILLTGLFSFGFATSRGQDATANTAYAGQSAAFIYHAFPPASPQYPNNSVTGFKLEREDVSNPGKWLPVKEFHTPQNAVELMENFKKAGRFFRDAGQVNFNAFKSWNRFIKYRTLDSLAFELAYTPAQMAFAVLVADTTVQKGKTYRYRVSQLGGAMGDKVQITNAISFPAVVKAVAPRVLRRVTEPEAIRIEWFSRGDYSTHQMRVYRRSDDEKVFKEIEAYPFIELKGDTLKYSIRDEHVATTLMYHYFIVPVNDFGGGGNVHSDTVSATCVDPRRLLTPQFFSAAGDEKRKAIIVKYRVPDPQFIGSIAVMRSTSYDNNYEQVGLASPTDSSYIDMRIDAGQKYYYYLIMADKTGRTSIRSNKTFGLYQSGTNDFPARYVTAVKQGKNVLISWQNPPGEKMSGYYVYRADGPGMPMKRLTVLLPSRDSLGSYLDTAQLRAGILYAYSVRSENWSNKESRDSKIAYLQTGTDSVALAAPKQVAASAEDKGVRLTWFDMRPLNAMQTAYRISRVKVGERASTILQENYPAALTAYLDTTAVQGVTYIYNIECLAGRAVSAGSSSNSITLARVQYPAPTGLVAFRSGEGAILKWNKVIDKRIKQFALYRYTRGNKPLLVATITPKSSSYVDKGTSNPDVYYYFLVSQGENRNNMSVRSNEAHIAIDK